MYDAHDISMMDPDATVQSCNHGAMIVSLLVDNSVRIRAQLGHVMHIRL